MTTSDRQVDADELDIDIDIVVEVTSSAAPEHIWEVIWDLERYGEWNRECVEARWLPGPSEPVVGARFCGRNEWNGQTWTVTCHIVECAPPTSVCWTVQDPAFPSSTWSYTLTATGSGSTVSQRFVHGPGNSGIRNMIHTNLGSADVVIAARTQMLTANMTAGLRAVVKMAEAASATGSSATGFRRPTDPSGGPTSSPDRRR